LEEPVEHHFFALGSVGLGTFMALTLAILLELEVKGLTFYRTAFFLPSLMPLVAASLLWFCMYAGQGGIINTLLAKIGITGPSWLSDPQWSQSRDRFHGVWGAGNSMVIFLAGLQRRARVALRSLDHRRRELAAAAAQRDDSDDLAVIYFNVIMGIIGGFQVFAQALIMFGPTTAGYPEQSTLFYVLQLYNVGFMDLRMGYASAMAWVLFLTSWASLSLRLGCPSAGSPTTLIITHGKPESAPAYDPDRSPAAAHVGGAVSRPDVWLFATSLQPREQVARCRPSLAAAVLHHAGNRADLRHAAAADWFCRRCW